MSSESAPEETTPVESHAEIHPSRTVGVIAVLAAFVLLVLPIPYLTLRHKPANVVSAQNTVAQAAGPSIAQMEVMVRGNPTEANRINLSQAYINGNQAERAVPLLLAIVGEDGNNAVAWNNLCVAHTLVMSYNLAIDDCNQALRVAPDFQLAKNNLKWAGDELKRVQVVIAQQEQVAPESRDAAFYLTEGLNFLHTGNYDQAIKAWQRTLQLNPKSAVAANNIGIAFMFKKQAAKAAPWFENALLIDPTMQLAMNNLAWAKDEINKAAK